MMDLLASKNLVVEDIVMILSSHASLTGEEKLRK